MSGDPVPAAERPRSKLSAVAYRMLGTVADAEDAVPDAHLRYHQHAGTINNPEPWLVEATVHTQDARAAGETEQRLYALSAWR